MTQKIITILGITGTQGGSVANAFLGSKEWHIRGITRNTQSVKATAWAAKGVEMVRGDQDDIDSLTRAFTGANAIFCVTDFISNFVKTSQDEELRKNASAQGKSISQAAADWEYAQGRNVATAASDPKVLATLEKFVLSTLTPINTVSGGKYKHVYQFESKANIENYIRQTMPELTQRLSSVNLGTYQENWRDMPVFGPLKRDNGVFEFVRLDCPGTHCSHPEVVASVDTGTFVRALVVDHPPGTDVVGASQFITRQEYAALWSRVVGRPAAVRNLSEAEFAKLFPEDLQDGILEFYKFTAEYGYTGGNPNVKTPAELGIQTTSLEQFIKHEDWSKAFQEVLSG